jgi:hypothetical protein
MNIEELEDPFYNDLYRVLHASMDRLIDAAATCEAHGDILSVDEDTLEYSDEDDEGDEDEGDQPKKSQVGGDDALRLLKAQIQAKGGDQDLPLLQGLITCSSNLLIKHHGRIKIRLNHKPIIE